MLKHTLSLAIAALFLITASGCTSLSPAEIASKQAVLDTMAESAIAKLIDKNPSLEGLLEASLAHAVANMKVTKVPVVGAGGGEGVLVVRETQERVYFTVKRIDVGGGWGVRSYKALVLINSQEILDKVIDGSWTFEAGAEVSAGTAALEGGSGDMQAGFTMHVLSDGGASATVTVRLIRMKVNKELTTPR